MTLVTRFKAFLFLAISFIMALKSFAQYDQIGSPYSRYGLGELYDKALLQGEALCGLSTGIRNSYHLNPSNPASLTAMDSMSFTFEFGISNSIRTLQSSSDQNISSDANFRYLVMGFPITNRWSFAVGLMPFSDVKFNIGSVDSTSNTGGLGNTYDYYRGENGINQIYISNGFMLSPNLSIGVNIGYLFGNIKRSTEIYFPNEPGAWNFEEIISTVVSDFSFDFGTQYYGRIKNKWDYTVGMTFNFKDNISAENDYLYQKYLNDSYTSDTIASFTNDDETIELPLGFGLGFSMNNENLMFGADFKYQNWSDIEIFSENPNLANSTIFATGFEYTPNPRSTNFFKRIRIRGGLKYENSYINVPLINDLGENTGEYEQLKDYGFSIGFGIPVRRTKSSINVSLKAGTRGTTEKNLIKENYAIISVNLSLHDIWFVKRKFD